MTKRQTSRTSTPRRVICLTPLQEARVAEVFAAAWTLRGFTREQLMNQNKSQRFHIVAARQEVMAALPHEPEGNIRAIEHYLTVCVLGERNRHATAAACAWGLYLLRQSRRGEHVAEALVSCGLEHGARLLAGILARDVRRAS